MKIQTPPFNYESEMYPFYQLVCERDNLKVEANFGQIKEVGKALATLIAEDVQFIGTLMVSKYMMNRTLVTENYYKKRIIPIIQKLCILDGKKQQANFGQMSEILKEISIIFEEKPTYLATMIRYSVHIKQLNHA
jgi:hypothetical protein